MTHRETQTADPNAIALPEIGKRIQVGDCEINYHDIGSGEAVLLIHGSGPGVTAWANWRGVIPALSERVRVIAPDMLGFGYTRCPSGKKLDTHAWVNQLLDLLDALDIKQVSVVGNSFGGAIALALAHRYPTRVKRLLLMGAVGVSFPLSHGLNLVWGYQPSIPAMTELMKVFAYDQSLINDDLVAMRYAASQSPSMHPSLRGGAFFDSGVSDASRGQRCRLFWVSLGNSLKRAK